MNTTGPEQWGGSSRVASAPITCLSPHPVPFLSLRLSFSAGKECSENFGSNSLLFLALSANYFQRQQCCLVSESSPSIPLCCVDLSIVPLLDLPDSQSLFSRRTAGLCWWHPHSSLALLSCSAVKRFCSNPSGQNPDVVFNTVTC